MAQYASTALSSPASAAGGPGNGNGDAHPGDEPILASFQLDEEHWKTYRCCTCVAATAPIAGGLGFLLVGIPYWLCGGPCRNEEAQSFSLHLTPTSLHYKMKTYSCGCCCQVTTTKSIPLDKIQVSASQQNVASKTKYTGRLPSIAGRWLSVWV